MNLKLSKKLVTGVAVLLITVGVIPAIAGAFTSEDGKHGKGFDMKYRHRPALGIWRDPQMVQKLELTAEQVKQLRDVDFTFREKRLELKAQLDSLRLQMEVRLAVGKLLNADQINKLKLYDMQPKKQVRKHCKKQI